MGVCLLSLSPATQAQEVAPSPRTPSAQAMFDGSTLKGWQGDERLWRVQDGLLVGGRPDEILKQNEFIATTRRYTNFVLRARFRLTGTGFVNSGIQIRSERVPGSSEMSGYQCDIGDPNWWGSLYDESRRNRTLAWSDMARIEPTLRRNDWNDYVIRAEGRRITTWVNGVLGVDYWEPDPEIAEGGRIGLQIHAGGAVQAYFKDLVIEELPARPRLIGAPAPAVPPSASPLSPEDQQKTFSLPPGFVAELVAAEPDGGKFVGLQFDPAGRLWTMTALEYPLDANEAGAEAKALFERGGRDRVLVFDTPTHPGRQTPRTFADGLVMPLGILPYLNGAYVQYGNNIRHYTDSNGDGRADGFTNVLTGFGIEDSHLFPHQFTRAPGGWFWLAQGAFNSSQVKTPGGEVTMFNKTKLARWRPDGSQFEIIGWGPCNIWGLVIDREGEVFIQEANDQGWPVMPFLEGASYPLCGDDIPRPYCPPFPKTGEKEMGGTGLSGLAYSEGGDSFPGEWRDVFFINNPITRKIQAVRIHRDSQYAADPSSARIVRGNGWRLEHLPDFVLSSDPWFRPVAMSFGPDGCLYVVDWYNQIISHNEVPRQHPDRDKSRGRIWRFRHESQPHRLQVPNLYTAPEAQLMAHLRADDAWEANAAWQQIVDRQALALAPELTKWATDDTVAADLRIRALWSLEGLAKLDRPLLETLERSGHRAVRREALRAAGSLPLSPATGEWLNALAALGLNDPDRLVRQESIRLLNRLLAAADRSGRDPALVANTLIRAVIRPPASADPKFGPYFNSFEAYLVRRALEGQPTAVRRWLAGMPNPSTAADRQAVAFAALALGGSDAASRLAAVASGLERPVTAEELVLLAGSLDAPGVRPVLESMLSSADPLRLLLEQRSQLRDTTTLSPLLVAAARRLVQADPSTAHQDLLVRLATGFRLAGLEPELVAAATRPGARPEGQLAALRALRESGSTRVDILRGFALSGDDTVRREAVAALAVARSDAAVPALLEVWPSLPPLLRKTAIDGLVRSPSSARQLVSAVTSGSIVRDELDGYTLDKLSAVLPGDPTVRTLQEELGTLLRPVLRLNGGEEDYVATALHLDGPFTAEGWVKLDTGISNADSLLGGAGQMDANFFDSRFRFWIAGAGDIVVASKPMVADAWTHVAVTRDPEGVFRIYLNGELDSTGTSRDSRRFGPLDVGHSTASGGTAGELSNVRIWTICRTPDQIRAAANLELPSSTPGLLYSGSGTSWGPVHGGAKMETTTDLPPVLTAGEASALASKFETFRPLAAGPGDLARGQQIFATTCGVCHTVKGVGGRIGPALDGAGAHGPEAVLRNVLTPNAAMEAGYRRFRVETQDGEVLEGLLAAQDADSVTLRLPGTEDQRFERRRLKRAGFVKGSVMPEGLLESLPPDQARDLLAYVLSLK